MDEAAERMRALKRVYAEIILHVTKESAARVLAAERKAMRLQKELAASKEEAIGTLLRVKGIMDVKISEAQKASLVQARRIQDLEALHGESKNTIKSLEAELKKVREKMDMATSSVKALNTEIVSKFLCNEDSKDNVPLSDPILSCPIPIHQSPTDKKSPSNKQSSTGDSCCEISADTLQPRPLEIISPENEYFSSHDFIMMQLKEPDLLKSGRKQRIRAFEQNTLTQEVCNGHEDQFLRSSSSKNGTVETTQIEGSDIDKILSDANTLKQSDVVPDFIPYSSLFLRKRRKIKRKRRKNMRLTNFVSYNKSIVSCDYSKNSRNSNQYCRGTRSNVSLASTEDCDPRSMTCHNEGRSSDAEIKLMETDIGVENTDGKEINRALESLQNSETRSLSWKGEASALIVGSDAVEKPLSETNLDKMDVSIGNDATRNGFLKYTFKRKRMRGTSSCANETEALVSEKRKVTWEKDRALQEIHKPSTLRTSSCDSRRIAQVARQLVSLSQKRWG